MSGQSKLLVGSQNSKSKYTDIIRVPFMKNGPTGFGGTYNSRKGEFIQKNIYAPEHLINQLEVDLTKNNVLKIQDMSSMKDILSGFGVGGHLSIGLENIQDISTKGGSISSERITRSYKSFLFHIQHEANSIRVSNQLAESNLTKDQAMKAMRNGATHVVHRIIYGYEITAHIEVEGANTLGHSQKQFSSGSEGVFSIGANIDGELEKFKSGFENNSIKNISIHSTPDVEVLSNTLEGLMNAVGIISARASDHKPYTWLNACGLPILYELIPIHEYAGISIYESITASIDLVDQVPLKQIDIYVKGILWRIAGQDYFKDVISKDNLLRDIISDEFSLYTGKLFSKQQYYQIECQRFLNSIKKINFECLEEIRTMAYKTIPKFLKNVDNALEELINEGRDYFSSVRIRGNVPKGVTIFASQSARENWLRTQSGAVILLNTKGVLTDETFNVMYRYSGALSNIGFQIGIALPMACNDSSITFFTQMGEKARIFNGNKIKNIVKIIKEVMGALGYSGPGYQFRVLCRRINEDGDPKFLSLNFWFWKMILYKRLKRVAEPADPISQELSSNVSLN